MTNRTHNYKVYIAADKKVYDVRFMEFEDDDGTILVKLSNLTHHYIDNTSVLLLEGTGKMDVNGNEIFEGMRIRLDGETITVEWSQKNLKWVVDFGDEVIDLWEIVENCEITGWSFEVE